MQSEAATVPAYLRELPADRRAALAALRELIKAAAPGVTEVMAHGMPVYELGGSMLFALASQKNYLALYVTETALVERFKPRLGKLSVGKSCIRFKALGDLNLDATRGLLVEAAARRG